MSVAVVLKKRPEKDSAVQVADFEVLPSLPSSYDEASPTVTLRLLCLSVDPYMRCRFNSSTGAEYMGPFQVGKPIMSGGSAVVTASCDERFEPGDTVVSQMFLPWQQEQTVNTHIIPDLTKLPPSVDPLLAPGPLGISGLSAFHGVEQCKPRSGELCVLSSCAGGVGSIAGQLFRQKGLRVIGICGAREKCAWSLEMGICDVALCYRDEDFATQLAKHCDGKVNLYFDNVGGWISEMVIEQLAPKGRIIVCGQISTYNQDTTRDDYEYPDPLSAKAQETMNKLEATRERFFVGWYSDKDAEALTSLQEMLSIGQLKAPVEWVSGLQHAGEAFVDMMAGKYQGKVMVDCRTAEN